MENISWFWIYLQQHISKKVEKGQQKAGRKIAANEKQIEEHLFALCEYSKNEWNCPDFVSLMRKNRYRQREFLERFIWKMKGARKKTRLVCVGAVLFGTFQFNGMHSLGSV